MWAKDPHLSEMSKHLRDEQFLQPIKVMLGPLRINEESCIGNLRFLCALCFHSARDNHLETGCYLT